MRICDKRLTRDLRTLFAWQKKWDVIRSYDEFASTYDRQYTSEQNAKIHSVLSKITLKAESIVLDLGCGTGLLFKDITGSCRMIVGLDISKKSLKKAKDRGKRFSNVSVILADADFIPLQDQVFDRVFAITLLQNMPDPVSSLHEMRRVCRNRSIIIVTGLKKWLSRHAFRTLIEKTGLKATISVGNEENKDHIAIIAVSHDTP